MFVRIFEKRFDAMYPLEEPINYLPTPNNSVAARAAAEGRDAEAWLYDYFLGNDAANLIYIPATNFTGNIPTGSHQLEVAVMGKLEGGRDFAETGQFSISKGVEPKLVGITLAGPGTGKPAIAVGDW